MIDCKFVFVMNGGAASDSLERNYRVPSIPRIGESLMICGCDSSVLNYEVVNVMHALDMQTGIGEVIVYYKCWRHLNSDPPCRSNIDPGRIAEFGISNCG